MIFLFGKGEIMFSYSYENLKRIIQTKKGKEIYKLYEEDYEKNYKDKEILYPRYSDYKLIYVNGDRVRYQNRFFEKLHSLRRKKCFFLS